MIVKRYVFFNHNDITIRLDSGTEIKKGKMPLPVV